MEVLKEIGPRLTDSEFFSELDSSIPEMAVAQKFFNSGDTVGAYHSFAEYIRKNYDIEDFCKRKGIELKPQFTDDLRNHAEMALNHYMVSVNVPMQFGKEIDWEANPTYNNYKEWTWQLSRHPEIATLAKAYRATGEEKYAAEAIYMLLSWIRQAVRTEYDASPYHDTLTWRTIECGIRMMNWPMIVYSVARSKAFTDEACVTIFKSLYEHGMRLTSMYTHGNWLFIELDGVANLACCITVFNRAKDWRDSVTEKIVGSLTHQLYPDSAQYELAPSYQGVALSCAFSVERIFAAYGYKFPDVFYDKMNSMCEFFVKTRMADGFVPPINDSERCGARSSIERYVKTYGGHPLGRWLCGMEGAKAPDFTTTVLPYAGFVAFRTGWGEGDVSAFFDAGKFGRDHHHEDRLNFLVYNDKKALVYEMGTYAYDTSPMRAFATQSAGHNTMLVDGQGQNRFCEKAWEESSYIHIKEDLRYLSEGDIEYAVGYFNGAYGNSAFGNGANVGNLPTPKRLLIHIRHIIMVKGNTPKDTLFIAYDKALSNDVHDLSVLWHLNVDEVEMFGNNATCQELTVFTDGFDFVECDVGVNEPEPRGWISRSNIQGDYYAAPQLTCKKNGRCPDMVTLFVFGSKEETPVCGVECNGGIIKINYKNGGERIINTAELHSKANIQ